MTTVWVRVPSRTLTSITTKTRKVLMELDLTIRLRVNIPSLSNENEIDLQKMEQEIYDKLYVGSSHYPDDYLSVVQIEFLENV